MNGADKKILGFLQGGEGMVDEATGEECDGAGMYPVGSVVEDTLLQGLDVSGGNYRKVPVDPRVADILGGTCGQLADMIANKPGIFEAGVPDATEVDIKDIPGSPSSLWLHDQLPTWKEIKPE